MSELQQKGFAEPAAFMARLIRRRGLRHFVFTGACLGEGTTTTVLGIARELHLSYSLRVLAVEISPHSDGFKEALELEQPTIDYAAETSLSAKDFRPVPAGFSILSLGRQQEGQWSDRDTAALLEKLLKSVGKGFDAVLIDVPPVLESPEVLAVASEVDGVMLVVEAGRTRLEMLEHIRRVFAREELKILGSVLTKQEHSIPNWFYRMLFK